MEVAKASIPPKSKQNREETTHTILVFVRHFLEKATSQPVVNKLP
jgi:hypothetical protein